MIVTVIVFFGWVASVCLHEFGHAIVAYWGGDTSVKNKGYLTLNPLKYTDVSLSLVLPLVFLLMGGIPLPGGAVYINHSLLRNRGWASVMSAAGPAMTLLIALFLSLPFRLGVLPNVASWDLATLSPQDQVWLAIAFLGLLEIAGAVLNLLPIPSLDGFGIINPWLSPSLQQQTRKLGRYGFLVLFALLWFVDPVNQVFWQFVYTLSQQFGIPILLSEIGYHIFRQWSWLPLVVLVATIAIRQRLQPRLQQQLSSEVAYRKTAISASEQVIKNNPDHPHSWFQRGQLLLEDQQFEDAEAAFHRAIQLQPDGNTWHLRGITLMYLQRYEAAIAAFDEALHLQTDQALSWIHRGRAQRSLHKYEDEIADYDQALALEPDNAELLCDRGLAHYHLNRFTAAIDNYDRATYLDPSTWRAWYFKGLALMPLEEYERAIRCFDHALDLQADTAQTWIAKGSALLHLADYEGAIASYNQALSLEPDNATAVYNQVRTYSLQGQLSSALKLLEQAFELDPKTVQQLTSQDSALDPLRSDAKLQQLVTRFTPDSDENAI